MTFYDIFETKCLEIGKKPREIAKEAGVKTSTLSMWKTQGVTPKYGTIKRIADLLEIEWSELVPENEQAQIVIDHIRAGLTVIEDKATGKRYLSPDSVKLLNRTSSDEFKRLSDDIEKELAEYEARKNDPDEIVLLRAYRKLNLDGQQKAVERVEELTEIPRYQKEKAPSEGD